MFNKFRFFIAYLLNKKALKLLRKREFTSTMKALTWLKYSLLVEPECDAKDYVIAELKKMAETEIT